MIKLPRWAYNRLIMKIQMNAIGLPKILLLIYEVCLVKGNFSSMIIPKNFVKVTRSKEMFLKLILMLEVYINIPLPMLLSTHSSLLLLYVMPITFRPCNSETFDRLHMTYCMHMYGCEL